MTRKLIGSCLCERVEYEVDDAFEYALICHCSRCRRATGSAFKPFGGIGRSRLQLVQGQESILVYGDPSAAHDVRCAVCGSILYSVVRQSQYVHVALGTLVDEPSIRPSEHIFVGSKARWYEIDDDLPQFPEFPLPHGERGRP